MVIVRTLPVVIEAHDFLQLLMSYLPSKGKYSNDARVWMLAAYILMQRHRREHAELFYDLKFVIIRPAGKVYSRKVGEWMRGLTMLIGGIEEPSYHKKEGLEYLEFPKKFQQKNKDNLVRRFSQEITALIQQFAGEIAKEGLLNPIRKM